MEAACAHAAGDQRWEDVLLPTGLEPGLHVEPEGRLFLADDNGYRVYDTVTEDGFTLDVSGYYTSGNAELDGYVTGILAGFLAEEPEADRERLLRMSYDYCCDSFTYLRKNAYYFGQTGWEVDDAVVMFSTLRGNCYNYAAAFWSLARGLGYDAQVISGTITQTNQPHGWVKMIHDGEKYYYDPEMEMPYRIKNNFSKDMFRMPRSYYSGWSYRE